MQSTSNLNIRRKQMSETKNPIIKVYRTLFLETIDGRLTPYSIITGTLSFLGFFLLGFITIYVMLDDLNDVTSNFFHNLDVLALSTIPLLVILGNILVAIKAKGLVLTLGGAALVVYCLTVAFMVNILYFTTGRIYVAGELGKLLFFTILFGNTAFVTLYLYIKARLVK